MVRVGSWLRRHYVHVLLSPLIFVSYTVVHECAHALAAWLQGAVITDFSVLPSSHGFGYVRYEFAPGIEGSAELVSAAPYVLWLGCMTLTVILSTRRKGYPFAVASTLFLWGFLGAWGDVALAATAWLGAGTGDWAHALGPPTVLGAVGMVLATLVAAVLGYFVQARLYRDGQLAPGSYATLWGCAGLVFAGASAL